MVKLDDGARPPFTRGPFEGVDGRVYTRFAFGPGGELTGGWGNRFWFAVRKWNSQLQKDLERKPKVGTGYMKGGEPRAGH